MATIIGCVTTSHVPAIGRAIEQGRQEEPYWKPFFDGFKPVHRWLAQARPDVVVVIYNDHGLNFFLDKLPTFAIGAAPEYRSADEGWNIPTVAPFPGDVGLSWHIIESVVAADFDITTCQEMVVDHFPWLARGLAAGRPLGTRRLHPRRSCRLPPRCR